MTVPTLRVVVLAFGQEAYLGDAVRAVLASEGVDLRVTVVDNGADPAAIAGLPTDERLTLLTPPRNLGFTGGVNLGLAGASEDVVALVNSDAIVERDCLALLAETALEDGVGVAGALILLGDGTGRVNSAWNPLHVLGLSWAGHLEEDAAGAESFEEEVGVSGACLALPRSVWEALGGFPEEFFAYQEDMDLCLRARQRGLGVRLVTGARAHHHYEFSRNSLKMYLLERNRLAMMLTVFEGKTLAVLAPPLLAFDLALLALAIAQGWGRQKARGWWWVLTHAGWIARRRRQLAAVRTVPDREILALMRDRFDARQMPLPAAASPLESALRAWWALGRRVLGVTRRRAR